MCFSKWRTVDLQIYMYSENQISNNPFYNPASITVLVGVWSEYKLLAIHVVVITCIERVQSGQLTLLPNNLKLRHGKFRR